MNPMENMAISLLSKMTGMEPDEMRGMAEHGMKLIATIDGRLRAIETALGIGENFKIIEAKENDDGIGARTTDEFAGTKTIDEFAGTD